MNIPEDELAPLVVEAPADVQNATPLAPLPEEPKPQAVQQNATTPAPQSTPPAQKQSQYAWSTEALSIEEGETKMVYVKK